MDTKSVETFKASHKKINGNEAVTLTIEQLMILGGEDLNCLSVVVNDYSHLIKSDKKANLISLNNKKIYSEG